VRGRQAVAASSISIARSRAFIGGIHDVDIERAKTLTSALRPRSCFDEMHQLMPIDAARSRSARLPPSSRRVESALLMGLQALETLADPGPQDRVAGHVNGGAC
jgi:hypothetical protein